jgi:uncharacterized OsmC-like protein
MANPDIRTYEVAAQSTEAFGRVLCSSRDHHFIVDGPVQNGCPGEAITPAEVFLSGVAACGVELVQVLAKQNNMALEKIAVRISGMMDRSKPAHPKYALFHSVHVDFRMKGITHENAAKLVELFQGR